MKTSNFKIPGIMVLFSLFCIFLFSCSNELQMNFPEGPEGKSAYEVWVENVKNGTIDWPVEDTDEVNFFKYLKGQKGDTGMSAYDQWLIEVANGTDNPHKPGTEWPKDQTKVSDFWYYLTGADGDNGLSAYELWKEDLANGTLPLKDGSAWPQDENTLADFWRYLTGADGKDGVIRPTPVDGMYNVLSEYSNSDYREYVSWETGGVNLTVYNDKGAIVGEGVDVKLSRGVDTTTVYTTNSNGQIFVSKDQLPTSGDNTGYKTSKVLVNGSWITTAANTYIPNKIDIRLVISDPAIDANKPEAGYCALLNVPFIVQRKIDQDHNWETIPAYVGDTKCVVTAYNVKEDGTKGTLLHDSLNVTEFYVSESKNVRNITRLTIDTDNIKMSEINPYYSWGNYNPNEKRFITLGIAAGNHCYGEALLADQVVQMAPMQPIPLPETFSVSKKVTETCSIFASYNANATQSLIPALFVDGTYSESSTVSVPTFTTCLTPNPSTLTTDELTNIQCLKYTYNNVSSEGGLSSSSVDPNSFAEGISLKGIYWGSVCIIFTDNNQFAIQNLMSYLLGFVNKDASGNAYFTNNSGFYGTINVVQ